MAVTPYQPGDLTADFHAVNSLTLGELIYDGWIDWNSDEWKWDYYSEEQYTRVCNKIENHYFDREIGILPLRSWQRRYLNLMNEIMPKYKYLYQALDDGVNILQDSDVYHKSRNVYSDFPATQLKGDTQDYASNATDNEYETITLGNYLDTAQKIKTYDDVDLMIIKELEPLFSVFYTVNINAM